MINQTRLFTNVSECIRNIGNEGQNINLFINELHLHIGYVLTQVKE